MSTDNGDTPASPEDIDRSDELNNNLVTDSAAASEANFWFLKYVILGNTGGAFAILGLIGALLSTDKYVSTPLFPLVVFILGIVVGGFSAFSLFGKAQAAQDDTIKQMGQFLEQRGRGPLDAGIQSLFRIFYKQSFIFWNNSFVIALIISAFLFVLGCVSGVVELALLD